MAEENEQTTLRDQLSQAFDEHTPPPEPVVESQVAAEDPPASKVADEPEKTLDTKPGRTANRLRDENGRLLPGKKETATAPATATPVQQPQAAAPAPVAAPTRPSSWKKDHWESFDKISAENPAVAQYILQREQEFARGVSAYKTELDHVKPIMDAIQPFLPELQKEGLEPAKWVNSLGYAHYQLAKGTPEQKLSMFLKLANDYKVPVQNLFTQQDGQVFYNPQVQPYQAQAAPQQSYDPAAIEKTVQAVIQRERTAADIEAMKSDSQKYPHFEAVRNTMAQLLDAGVSQDLQSAYEAALALPQHRELAQAQQEQQRLAEEKARKEKQAADALRARQASVSPRSATPAVAGKADKKGLRGQLEEAFEEHHAGRV